jgi:hypothetical protein
MESTLPFSSESSLEWLLNFWYCFASSLRQYLKSEQREFPDCVFLKDFPLFFTLNNLICNFQKKIKIMRKVVLLVLLVITQLSFSAEVTPPIAVAIGPQMICDDNANPADGFCQFDLTNYIPLLLAGNPEPISNYTVTFYTDAAHTNAISNPSSYTNTINPQVIYVKVTHIISGQFTPTSFDLIVNTPPNINILPNFSTCDNDGNNNGYYLYPLNVLIPGILGSQNPANFTVTFYNSASDALMEINPITDPATYQTYTHSVWISVKNNATNCFSLSSFTTTIDQYPTPVIQTTNGNNTFCVDYITGNVLAPLH